ncbi:MAG: hypothetical protein HWD85_13330 [Flavobacteriaceae bacterium]|nr:hypothetical protein [Flavobacteriaceae bacterium]
MGTLILSYPFFVWSAYIYDKKFKNNPKRIKENKNGYGFLANRIKEAEETENVDILILGSSLAYRVIDTRSFDSLGLKAFNLGSSSQTPLQTEFLVDQYLSKLNPKLIIWDISPSLFSISGFESFVDIASNAGFQISMLKQVFEIGEIEGVNTLMLSALDPLIRGGDYHKMKYKTNREIYIKGGFAQNIRTNYERFKPLKEVKLELIPYQKKSFERTLTKLRGFDLVLVMAPIRPEDYEKMIGVESFKEYINLQINTFEGIRFYNFNEPLIPQLESLEYFYDEFHLNQKGVELYNKALIDSVFNFETYYFVIPELFSGNK